MAKSKLDPYMHLLGNTGDSAIAKLAGCSRERVRQVRYARNIPIGEDLRKRGKPQLPPEVHETIARLAGTASDKQVGLQAGCSYHTVLKYRRDHGVPTAPDSRKTKFTEEHYALMGTMSDKAMAKLVGCSVMVAFRERKHMGIKMQHDGRTKAEREKKRNQGLPC
jgi:hypothetical protein